MDTHNKISRCHSDLVLRICQILYNYIWGLFQITNWMHNSFIIQQYVCYTTILNMFWAAPCSKHVEDCSVTYCWRIKELCIKLVIWKSLYYDA